MMEFGFEEEVLFGLDIDIDVADATEDTVQTPVSGVHRRSSQDHTHVAANALGRLNAFRPENSPRFASFTSKTTWTRRSSWRRSLQAA